MSMLSDDLASIFADTSLTVSVEFGTVPVQSTRGFLSTDDVMESDGHGGIVQVARRTLTIIDGSLSDLASDETIVADDEVFTIHGKPRSAGRGKVKITLAEGS